LLLRLRLLQEADRVADSRVVPVDRFSVDAPFLIVVLVVAPAELLALASVRRVDLQVPALGVRCILRVARLVADLREHVPALASVPVDRAVVPVLVVLALEWAVVPAD
jgi:hypothetical protein